MSNRRASPPDSKQHAALLPDTASSNHDWAPRLALDYGGIDFGLGPDGDLLLFEANATMVIFPA